MNEQLLIRVATRRGRNLDQPDLELYNTPGMVWQAWAPVESLISLPYDAEALLDLSSARLGHLAGDGWRRAHAWKCADAAAWGASQPLPMPQWPQDFSPVRRGPGQR